MIIKDIKEHLIKAMSEKENTNRKNVNTKIMLLTSIIFIVTITSIILISKKHYANKVDTRVKKALSLVNNLTTHPKIIESINEANDKNASLTQKMIMNLDNEWKSSTEKSFFITQYKSNKAAKILFSHISQYPEFKEIFITDANGLNVAITSKTNDYYQADEAWWVETFNNSTGRESYAGDVEYDESAKIWSFPLYACIKSSSGKTIGVIKAVLDIQAVR